MLIPFFEARAWRIATQIVCQAPRSLTLLESAFNGHYIFHSVVPRDAASPLEAYEHRLVDVNRHGTMVDSPGRSFSPELEEALREPTLLFDPAPNLYRKLTTELGLPDPRPLPPSTPETLSFRFVVAWLQLHSALGRSHACRQGADTIGTVRSDYFGTFQQPELASLSRERKLNPHRWHPEYRFWFIVEGGGPPLACVSSDGMLHTPDGTLFDIGTLYRNSARDMWPPVAAVRTHMERVGLVLPP